MDADFEDAFAEALTFEMGDAKLPVQARTASPRGQGALGFGKDRFAPDAASAATRTAPAAGLKTPTKSPSIPAEPRESGLEAAIRGLSAPAAPRDAIVAETQSFAPERVVEEQPREIAAPEMDDFDELIASELAAMSRHGDYAAATTRSYQASYENHHAATAAGQDRRETSLEAADRGGVAAAPSRATGSRRRMALAGGVLSLALIGAAGLYAWNDIGFAAGPAASSDPLLIKADAEPYKVLPKDPGGRAIPNQNKAVYDRVATPSVPSSPTQQALLTDAEEPLDLPAEEQESYEDLPGVEMTGNIAVGTEGEEGPATKNEGRLEQASVEAKAASPVQVLQPHKVRTMVVRPDGTLVAAGDSASGAVKAPVLAAGVPALIEASSPVLTAGAANAADTSDVAELRPAKPMDLSADTADAPKETAGGAPAGQLAELPPAGMAPAEAGMAAGAVTQVAPPVEVASVAAPAASPAQSVAAALPAGGYFVQISSQPSEALAQQSLQSLGKRFSGVIAGRSVGVQSAEIPGKGTFYRVRVAASSKGEASTLCTRLKSAGGTCFVTR